jgi:protein TonB
MFEESMLESTPLLRTHNRLPALLSLAAQLTAAATVLMLPLLHPALLPTTRLLPATLAPPVFHPTPLPIRLKPTLAATSAPAAPGSAYNGPTISLVHPSGPAVDAPPLGNLDLDMRRSSLPPGINSAAPGSPHVTVGPASAKSNSAPTRISRGVSAGLLLTPLRPEYPAVARITRTEGTVVVDAIISRAGAIESAHVVSGPTLLQAAALAAVRQARYRPFLLSGQPTEVQTTFTINFRLGS